MSTIVFVLFLLLAYLLGSIPTSVWYGLRNFGIDIRQHGSKNAGATNTFRVLGKRAGTIVMLVDILKGWAATMLAWVAFSKDFIDPEQLLMYKFIFGVAAIVGHIFPVLANFKGGKGVATLLGMVLAIHPELALICIAVFILTLIASQYVSLSSILATLAFPVVLLLGAFGKPDPSLVIFGFAMFVMVVYTHRKNIIRLFNGSESRTKLFGNKNKS